MPDQVVLAGHFHVSSPGWPRACASRNLHSTRVLSAPWAPHQCLVWNIPLQNGGAGCGLRCPLKTGQCCIRQEIALDLASPVVSTNAYDRILCALAPFAHGTAPLPALAALITAGLDQLPLPGAGATWQRWQALARVAAHDLALAKLFEGHTDALAIFAELDAPAVTAGSSWGVWAADPPQARVLATPASGRQWGPQSAVWLNGRKAWCSGADGLSHALLTVRDDGGTSYLAAVALDAPGIRRDAAPWQAIGMAGSASIDVHFSNVRATLVGKAGAYLERPGFWHGGAGIAACWYGAAAAIGERMRAAVGHRANPHFLAHLGHVAVALSSARAVLSDTAARIDSGAASMAAVLQTRLAVEHCASDVVAHAGRALGAGPLCREPHFAALMADLPVFIRQSHAERDLAELGSAVLAGDCAPWSL